MAEAASGKNTVITVGTEKTELMALRNIYNRIMDDSTFSSFKEFRIWAKKNRKKDFVLYKKNEYMPHSQKNSYWYYKHKQLIPVQSKFCESCDQKCNTSGCFLYREWFVKNWNSNIYGKPMIQTQAQTQESKDTVKVFQYEHPDLVREGVVFEGSCSV